VWEINKKNVLKLQEKTYIEKFNIPTVLTGMFTWQWWIRIT